MYQLELDDLQTNDELKDTFDAKDSVKFYAGLVRLKVFKFEETSSSLNNSAQQYTCL